MKACMILFCTLLIFGYIAVIQFVSKEETPQGLVLPFCKFMNYAPNNPSYVLVSLIVVCFTLYVKLSREECLQLKTSSPLIDLLDFLSDSQFYDSQKWLQLSVYYVCAKVDKNSTRSILDEELSFMAPQYQQLAKTNNMPSHTFVLEKLREEPQLRLDKIGPEGYIYFRQELRKYEDSCNSVLKCQDNCSRLSWLLRLFEILLLVYYFIELSSASCLIMDDNSSLSFFNKFDGLIIYTCCQVALLISYLIVHPNFKDLNNNAIKATERWNRNRQLQQNYAGPIDGNSEMDAISQRTFNDPPNDQVNFPAKTPVENSRPKSCTIDMSPIPIDEDSEMDAGFEKMFFDPPNEQVNSLPKTSTEKSQSNPCVGYKPQQSDVPIPRKNKCITLLPSKSSIEKSQSNPSVRYKPQHSDVPISGKNKCNSLPECSALIELDERFSSFEKSERIKLQERKCSDHCDQLFDDQEDMETSL